MFKRQIKAILFLFCLSSIISCYSQNVFDNVKILSNKKDTIVASANGFSFFSLSDGVCCFVFSNAISLEEEIKKSKFLNYILFDGNKFLDYFNVFEYVDSLKINKSTIKLSSNKSCENGDKISYYRCKITFLFTKKHLKSKSVNSLKFCLNNGNKNIKLSSIFKIADPTMNVINFKTY